MSQLPLNALRVFESVVRQDSFRAAAEELCVSQSAVSHQIRHLEQWFNGPLFDRGGSRPRALPRAQALADTLRHSLAEIEHACERARACDKRTADLIIAAIPSVAVCWLIPHLSQFRRQHPDIAIRVIYAFHGQTPEPGEVDFSFVYADGDPGLSGTRALCLLPGAGVPVCSPTIAASLDPNMPLTASSDTSFLHDSNNLGWQLWFRKATGTACILPGPVFEDFNLLRAAVLAGQGVALCPPAMLHDDLSSGRLVQLSDITVNDSWNYYLLEHDRPGAISESTVIGHNAARHFMDWMLTLVGQTGWTGASSHADDPRGPSDHPNHTAT